MLVDDRREVWLVSTMKWLCRAASEIFFSTMVLQIYYVTSASYPYSALTLAWSAVFTGKLMQEVG